MIALEKLGKKMLVMVKNKRLLLITSIGDRHY